MPAEDRAETITYYREYAQEGGLLDAGQLREHLGPPEVLAARILEDGAGKRTQNAPKGRKGVLSAAVLAGIVLAVVALGIGAYKFLRPGTVEPFADISVDVVSARGRVEIGDTDALRYTLLDDEVVEQAGVEGQTLYLISHNKTDQGHYDGFGEVCITVPADACLGPLQFSTVGGGVTVPELSCDSVSVDNAAGNAELNCVAENNVMVNSTSGTVEFGG